jgi:hypothetical protein
LYISIPGGRLRALGRLIGESLGAAPRRHP